MKELSIEEKAKAYDEAVEKAREYYNVDIDNTMDVKARGTMLYLFPELQTEDEKIRNEICIYIGGRQDISLDTHNRWLDWLEKQGEQKSAYKEHTFKSIPRLLEMIEPTDRAKSYCKKLIDSLQTEGYSIDAKIVGECLRQMNGENVPMAVMDIKEQCEQKSANKIEPKFKVGDWITNGELLVDQVTSVDGEYYHYMCDGLEQPLHISNAHKWRLWTIKDAKDGDVLYDRYNACIFRKKMKDDNVIWVDTYCGINSDGMLNVNDEDERWCLACDCVPATKEQRDFLFAKMKEAGYEWNAEKKELKLLVTNGGDFESENCEQKSAWSEEDKKMLDGIILRCEKYGHQEQIDWLKSLKPQSHWKPTEEQLHAFEQVYDWYNNNFAPSETLTSLYNDLKKLKQ